MEDALRCVIKFGVPSLAVAMNIFNASKALRPEFCEFSTSMDFLLVEKSNGILTRVHQDTQRPFDVRNSVEWAHITEAWNSLQFHHKSISTSINVVELPLKKAIPILLIARGHDSLAMRILDEPLSFDEQRVACVMNGRAPGVAAAVRNFYYMRLGCHYFPVPLVSCEQLEMLGVRQMMELKDSQTFFLWIRSCLQNRSVCAIEWSLFQLHANMIWMPAEFRSKSSLALHAEEICKLAKSWNHSVVEKLLTALPLIFCYPKDPF